MTKYCLFVCHWLLISMANYTVRKAWWERIWIFPYPLSVLNLSCKILFFENLCPTFCYYYSGMCIPCSLRRYLAICFVSLCVASIVEQSWQWLLTRPFSNFSQSEREYTLGSLTFNLYCLLVSVPEFQKKYDRHTVLPIGLNLLRKVLRYMKNQTGILYLLMILVRKGGNFF